jgi:glycosyltransferase involved in cell wall biosynthesis
VPFECAVLGEGNDRARCERLCARLGLSGRVKFHGFVRSEELKDYYLDASVAVVSSVWPEPFGMTGPEAMLYGLPVVAFDAGGIREWLADGETGYLVPWMDTGTFAARLEQLLQDKGLARQLGDRARAWASGQYDAERQFDYLESVFLSVCQETQNKHDEKSSISISYEFCR